MKKTIIAIAMLIVVGAGAYVLLVSQPPKVASDCVSITGKSTTIIYTQSQQFTPGCAKVNSGTVITYVNQSGKTLEVGANPHPIHTGNREVSTGKFTLDIAPGSSGQTTVTKKGTFGYHDHEHDQSTGTIVVQ